MGVPQMKHTTNYQKPLYMVLYPLILVPKLKDKIKMMASSRLVLLLVLISTISIHMGSATNCDEINERLLTVDYCVSLLARRVYSKIWPTYKDATADRILNDEQCVLACQEKISSDDTARQRRFDCHRRHPGSRLRCARTVG